jgi:hypothetical protein
MVPDSLLPQVLFLFGIGFFVANLKALADIVRFRMRKASALLVWQNPKPRYYGFALGLGAVLGALVVYKIFYQDRVPGQVFGEVMMFLYYGYAFPMSTRISRGFYQDGVLLDSGFMRWGDISAVSWKEGERVTLVVISHFKSIARRLEVPGELYGQARRVLRDKVTAHDIHIGGAGLDLGSRDEKDAI